MGVFYTSLPLLFAFSNSRHSIRCPDQACVGTLMLSVWTQLSSVPRFCVVGWVRVLRDT